MHTHRGAYINALGEIIAHGLTRDSVFLWTLPLFHSTGWCFPWALTPARGIPRPPPPVRPVLIFSLTEPARAQILKFLLLNGRADISTIAEALPQDRSVISRHLNMLAEAGIVIAEKDTRHRYYTIDGAAFLNEFEAIVDNIRKCMAECCPDSL